MKPLRLSDNWKTTSRCLSLKQALLVRSSLYFFETLLKKILLKAALWTKDLCSKLFSKLPSVYTWVSAEKPNPLLTMNVWSTSTEPNKLKIFFFKREKNKKSFHRKASPNPAEYQNLLSMRPIPGIFWFREHPTRITVDRKVSETNFGDVQTLIWLPKLLDIGNEAKKVVDTRCKCCVDVISLFTSAKWFTIWLSFYSEAVPACIIRENAAQTLMTHCWSSPKDAQR